MGHDNQGGTLFLIQSEQQIPNPVTGSLIQNPGGFVGEQQRRPCRIGARNGNALLLPAGELSRIVFGAIGETDAGQDFLGRFSGHRVCGEFQRQHDVFQCGKAGQQLKGLEHEADPLGPKAGTPVLIHCEQVGSGKVHAALGRCIESASSPSRVDLPEPEAPTTARVSPLTTLKSRPSRIPQLAVRAGNTFAQIDRFEVRGIRLGAVHRCAKAL